MVNAAGAKWAAEELGDLLSELRESLDQVEQGCKVMAEDGERVDHRTPPLYEVFRLVAASRSDGFPRRSGVSEGGPASVLDERGDPMPPRSDPTGELAVAEMRSNDPIRRHAQGALRALVDARNLLRKAKSETIQAFEETDASDEGVGEPRCRPHALADSFVETFRGDRCRWCYDFWRAEGVDPPVELIILRDQKGKVSTRDVQEALAAERAKTMAKRSKKKRKSA